MALRLVKEQNRDNLPVLPNEIWMYIGQFLQKQDLAKVYALCPLFLDLWMRIVYTEVILWSMTTPSTVQILNAMTELAARYVSKLIIRPQLFGSLGQSFLLYPTRNRTLAEMLRQMLRRLSNTTSKRHDVALQALLTKILQMTNLQSLVVESPQPHAYRLAHNTGMFLEAVQSHTIRVENLEINVPLERLEDTLAPILPLMKLQSLSLSLWAESSTAPTESSAREISRMISLQSETLQRLSLINTDFRYKCYISSILSHLEHLQNLQQVFLKLNVDSFVTSLSPTAPKLEPFLQAHAEQLEKLELHFYGPCKHLSFPALFKYPLFNLYFPSLTHFHLFLFARKLRRPELPADSCFTNYLSQYRLNLQHLTITTRVLCSSELQGVAVALGGSNSSLLSLRVQLGSLEGGILDVLAVNLVSLLRLDLGTPSICNISDGTELTLDQKTQFFVQSMSECSSCVGSWTLRHLRFYIREYICWEGIREVLLSKLSKVETFNGYSRAEAMAINFFSFESWLSE